MNLEFTVLQQAVMDNFKSFEEENHLFKVDLDKDELWNLYLDSFPEGYNNVFRERREYDCSCCRQFIKEIGSVVIIVDNQIKTIWEFDTGNEVFNQVVDKLDRFVKAHAINNIYASDTKKIGTLHNYEMSEDGTIKWNHFYLELPSKFTHSRYDSLATIQNKYRTNKSVFQRALEEITSDSVEIVLELISQNSLYRGDVWQDVLEDFLKYKEIYTNYNSDSDKNNFVWSTSVGLHEGLARIRNTSMGTLLVDISEGMELDQAVRQHESITAPENYQRSKPIFTKKMLEDARKKVDELGYKESLQRRFATIDDVNVSDVLFSNKDEVKQRDDFDIFDEMEGEVAINPKKFSRVEEIGISTFIENVLPNLTKLEALVENKHIQNFTSLIASQNSDSKSMFKWDNNFGWAYTGNITDSSMRENVKSAGGKIDGVLRFSIQWNDGDNHNPDDFDAHCIEPSGNEIYYGNDRNYNTKGELDVDIINPQRGKAAVENITWPNKEKMRKGKYLFFVNNYADRGGRDGFKSEIEFDGEVHSFEYNKPLKNKEKIKVAEVTLHEDGSFTIKDLLESTSTVTSKEMWNINTNQFVPVSTVMLSPNYWGDNAVGNKHYMIMLKNCINPEKPNGMFNEFLNNELRPHRKVFEALGSKLSVEDDKNQLSGLGFSSTKRNELIVKATGKTERVLKIKF